MIPGKMLTPEDVGRITERRKWQILVPFVLIFVVTVAYSYSLPNLYRSDTLILVVPQRIPESYVQSTVTTNIEDRLRSINEQILSRTRLEEVLREFGLFIEERQRFPMEQVVALMRSQVTVTPVRGDSFRVAFTSSDPQLAMKVTSRLASMYIDENLRDREIQAQGTNEFLEAQLETARQRLVEHEKKLETYRRNYAGELPTQLQSNLLTIQGQRVQLQTLTESIDRDRDRRLTLAKNLSDAQAAEADRPTTDVSASTVPQESAATQKLELARTTLHALEVRFTPAHPDVIAARRQVAELERLAAAEPRLAVTERSTEPQRLAAADLSRLVRERQLQDEIDKIDREIAAKQAETERVRKSIAEYQSRVDAIPSRETELTELMRDYKTLQDIYVSLLEKKEASKLSSNLEQARAGEQFKILDPARLPERPSSPDRFRMNLLGAIFGLGLGVGLATLLEYRDTSLRVEEEIVRFLALPVVATIPVMRTRLDQRIRRRILWSCAATVVALALSGAAFFWKMGAFR